MKKNKFKIGVQNLTGLHVSIHTGKGKAVPVLKAKLYTCLTKYRSIKESSLN
jgi:hypothetical protein